MIAFFSLWFFQKSGKDAFKKSLKLAKICQKKFWGTPSLFISGIRPWLKRSIRNKTSIYYIENIPTDTLKILYIWACDCIFFYYDFFKNLGRMPLKSPLNWPKYVRNFFRAPPPFSYLGSAPGWNDQLKIKPLYIILKTALQTNWKYLFNKKCICFRHAEADSDNSMLRPSQNVTSVKQTYN